MKTYLAMLFVLLVSSMAASAAISIDSVGKEQFSLGDKITVSYNLSLATEQEALFRLSLECPSYSLGYFTTPVSLVPGSNKSIVAPSISANSQMLGECMIISSLQSTDKKFSEELKSDKFYVTDIIGISLDTNGRSFYPSEKIELAGNVVQSFSTPKTITISFERQTLMASIGALSFNQTIEIPKSIRSGTHKIVVTANDSYGNSGQAEAEISVAQVPSIILISLSKERINPGDEIKGYATILDQANDTMDGKLTIKITSQDKNELMSRDTDSKQSFSYQFDKYAAPGIYTVKATSQGLKSEKRIAVNTIESVVLSFDGKRVISSKNTGNVNYEKNVNIKLTTEQGNVIPIEKKISLKPGEESSVDIYREAPAGTYDVSFASGGEQKVFQGIATQDERSIGKKVSDGLGGITGMVTGTAPGDAVVFKKPFLVLLTMLAIAVLSVVILRGERQRRKELAERKRQQQLASIPKEESSADEIAGAGNPLDRDKHKKFVEDMLKEKQFK
ncbi:hypothetical protein HYY72_01530 [Candidatus Woesearchaeota archaeon]|nr:hypothetical protein [Candidatus Woesearchaeota archaeon]